MDVFCSVRQRIWTEKDKLLFPEGNGLINGWTMLEESLQDMGYKGDKGVRRKVTKPFSIDKVENQKEELLPGTIWMDISECCPKGDLGLLKFGVVGCWKTLPGTPQSLIEVEAWAKRVWKLEGRIAIYPLNQNLFFMGFELSEEARWVVENGSRICRGGELQLEWWTPYSGCKGVRDQENEVWIRVVGLPLHLWTGEILKKVGDNCGGFVALDEAGARSYELQIWWEIRPTVAEVFPRSSRISEGPAVLGEEDVRVARAIGSVKTGWGVKRRDYRDGQSKVCIRTTLGSGVAESRLSTSQPRGRNFKAGPKIDSEIQNAAKVSGKKGKPKNSLVLESTKERYGPRLAGDSAHATGQTQGVFPGPSLVNIGEQRESPMERDFPTVLRGDCKGRVGGKIEAADPRSSGSKE